MNKHHPCPSNAQVPEPQAQPVPREAKLSPTEHQHCSSQGTKLLPKSHEPPRSVNLIFTFHSPFCNPVFTAASGTVSTCLKGKSRVNTRGKLLPSTKKQTGQSKGLELGWELPSPPQPEPPCAAGSTPACAGARSRGSHGSPARSLPSPSGHRGDRSLVSVSSRQERGPLGSHPNAVHTPHPCEHTFPWQGWHWAPVRTVQGHWVLPAVPPVSSWSPSSPSRALHGLPPCGAGLYTAGTRGHRHFSRQMHKFTQSCKSTSSP